MIEITKEQFEQVVTAAATPTEGIFESMTFYFEQAFLRLTRELLGDEMANDLSKVPGLEDTVRSFVCLNAFYNAIPHLDLILTSSGFGIVSNQNIAPASADRVQRLRDTVLDASGQCYDDCMFILMGTDWADTPQAHANIFSLIFCIHSLEEVGITPATRSKLMQIRGDLLKCNDIIERIISPELHRSLLDGIRRKDIKASGLLLIDLCRRLMSAVLTGKTPDRFIKDQIIEFLRTHLDEFPDYRNSSVYAALNVKPYENRQEDTCYFFR